MALRELGLMSEARIQFNSIPRDNIIRGLRTREEFLEKVNKRVKEIKEAEDIER